MRDGVKWFERGFDFTFPVELRGSVISRLRGGPVRLEETLRGRAHEVPWCGKRRGNGRRRSMLGTCWILSRSWLARVGDYVAGKEQLTAADLQNRKTEEANHNARAPGRDLREFRANRAKLLHSVQELDGSLFSRAIPHPRLKVPMRLVDHLYFVAEHDDHHLARIWEMVDPS